MRIFLTICLIFLLNTGALMSENAYNYSFKNINEEDTINLSDYKGKTLVVVNTASLCGFTYQYDCLLYTSPSPRDVCSSRMPSSA